MRFPARYNDGRAAVTIETHVAFTPEGLDIDGVGVWPWAEVRRADDDVGDFILRREPDLGARIRFDRACAEELRAAAPSLFGAKALRRGGANVALGLAGAAVGLLVLFLVALPYAAGPIARAAPISYEERIGSMAWNQAQHFGPECDRPSDQAGLYALDDAVDKLDAVAKTPMPLQVHVISAPFPNAFALPGGYIVVTSELIDMTQSPDELTGVIAHELAHLKRRHALAGVIRQMGLGVFADVVLGGGGVGQAIAAASINVASLHYDREIEAEADRLGIAYLDGAGFDPAGLGHALERLLAFEKKEGAAYPQLLSTHPATEARIALALKSARPGRSPSMTETEWIAVKHLCGWKRPKGGETVDLPDPESDATGEDDSESSPPENGGDED